MESRQKELAKILCEMTFGDLMDFSRALLGNIKSIQEEDQYWMPNTNEKIAFLLHGWAENKVDDTE